MSAVSPVGQRGIALLIAIILVAIAAVLATAIAFASAMSARRATTVFGADQSLLAAEGAEAMAAYVLRAIRSSQSQDSLNQPWAQSYGPFELLPGVTLEFAQLEDQQGKFNINDLVSGGTTNPSRGRRSFSSCWIAARHRNQVGLADRRLDRRRQ